MTASVRLSVNLVRVHVDQPAAHRIAMDHATFLVTDVTRLTFNRAQILTPVDTGNLRSHNRMRVNREASRVVGEVFNDAEYAAAVHNGSGPYEIRPKKRRGRRGRPAALRFQINGQVVYARRVRHPGTKGRPWLQQAVLDVAVPRGFVWTPG